MPTLYDPKIGTYDEATGEVLEPIAPTLAQDASEGSGTGQRPRRRRKRAGDPEAAAGQAHASGRRPGFPRTPEEVEAAARVKSEREAWRKREIAALEALVPSFRSEAEPPVPLERAVPLDARTASGRPLAVLRRENGSEVHVCAKTYDGALGGVARTYAHVCLWFRGMGGYLVRSKGVGLNDPAEMRAVGQALASLADELEADGWKAPGPVPWRDMVEATPPPPPVERPPESRAPAARAAPQPSASMAMVIVECGTEAMAERVAGNLADGKHTTRAEGTRVIVTAPSREDAGALVRRLRTSSLPARVV